MSTNALWWLTLGLGLAVALIAVALPGDGHRDRSASQGLKGQRSAGKADGGPLSGQGDRPVSGAFASVMVELQYQIISAGAGRGEETNLTS